LPYFENEQIASFRQLKSATGTIISGSTALQFFDRTRYPNSDLDIYVEARYSGDMMEWFFDKGFKLELRPGLEHIGHTYFGMTYGIATIFNIFRSGDSHRIQLITTVHSPMRCILRYHSSKYSIDSCQNNYIRASAACVMNVITHAAAYLLYPYATFCQCRTLVCNVVTHPQVARPQENALQKYRFQGWDVDPTIHKIEDPQTSFDRRRCWVGDDYCWTISLDPNQSGELLPHTPCDLIALNSWHLGFSTSQQARPIFHAKPNGYLPFHYVQAEMVPMT
jgi:hypothetical protein